MGREQIKNKNKLLLKYFKENEKGLRKYLFIAMLAIIAVIAIILVDLTNKNNSNAYRDGELITYDLNEALSTVTTEDENVNRFIKEYFDARVSLNYSKLFQCFGRDYYREEREDKTGDFQKVIDSIRYEKIFVKNYNNVYVYSMKGLKDGDVLCIVTYDLDFGFSDGEAPMVTIFYLEARDNSFVIKDNLDVGTSKFIVEVTNTEPVRNLYNDIETRLSRILTSNEALRLAYNSLRQYEININYDLGPINKREMIENIGIKKLDPIKDSKFIYNEILKMKEENMKREKIDTYMLRVIASLSDVQRIPLLR